MICLLFLARYVARFTTPSLPENITSTKHIRCHRKKTIKRYHKSEHTDRHGPEGRCFENVDLIIHDFLILIVMPGDRGGAGGEGAGGGGAVDRQPSSKVGFFWKLDGVGPIDNRPSTK